MKQLTNSTKIMTYGVISLIATIVLFMAGVYIALSDAPVSVQHVAVVGLYISLFSLVITIVLFSIGLMRFTKEAVSKKTTTTSITLAIIALLFFLYLVFRIVANAGYFAPHS